MGKQFATFLWLVVLAAWFGTYRFVQYQVDMYYSNLAAKQFGDDSAYGELKFHGTADGIAWLVFLVGVFFCIYRIIKVWSKQKPVTSTSRKP